MRKVWTFLLGMVVGGGLIAFGFKYHVVHANDGVILVPKQPASFSDLYVDVRSFKASDWQNHPDLVHSLVAHGRSDVVGPSVNEFLNEVRRKLGNADRPEDDLRME